MGKDSKIEWTDHTFNPWWGCRKVSPACDHCYAERDAKRYAPGVTLWGEGSSRRTFGPAHWNDPLRWAKAARVARGAGLQTHRPRVFCASMADVFDNHPDVEGERQKLWGLIENTPELDWLLLTKRIGNAKTMLPPSWLESPRRNVWLGISVVNQAEADRDIPKLLATPAAVRFLSCEPLQGPIDLEQSLTQAAGTAVCCTEPGCEFCDGTGEASIYDGLLDWVIVGGESGPGARPMAKSWVDGIHAFCCDSEVPFFFKQWGEWAPLPAAYHFADAGSVNLEGRTLDGMIVDGSFMVRMGKKTAGRGLDGDLWSEFPESPRCAP